MLNKELGVVAHTTKAAFDKSAAFLFEDSSQREPLSRKSFLRLSPISLSPFSSSPQIRELECGRSKCLSAVAHC